MRQNWTKYSPDAHEACAEDRALLLLPLFHVNAILVTLLSPLLAGGSVALLPGFRTDRFWGDLARYRPTRQSR